MNKKFAISYSISEIPESYPYDEMLKIYPVVVLYSELGFEYKPDVLYPPVPIMMSKQPKQIEDIFRNKNDFFKKIGKLYRANQERIISDIICGIILREIRNEKNKKTKLIFFITNKFDTSKIVGRLAYLNLPMNRVVILFMSRNIIDFYTRNIVSPFEYKYDLAYLNDKNAENSIYGPFPDDGSINLIRTFYKTYDEDIYPLKIDLFSQSLDSKEIIQIKNDINNDYLSKDNTIYEKVYGLKDNNQTKIPIILSECEIELKKQIGDKT